MKDKGKNSLDRGESTRGTDELGKNELFELVLHDIGGFGRFQVITTVHSINVIRKDPYLVSANTLFNQIRLLVLSLLASIVAAMNHLGVIYIAFSPPFECTIEEDEGLEDIDRIDDSVHVNVWIMIL